jgi:uncharacterized protein (TIGR00266 family)
VFKLRYVIEGRPAYSILKVWLEPGESITVEPGSYMLHRGEVEVSTETGGIGGAIARRLFGGESVFLNTFRARGRGAEVWVAPGTPGDIGVLELNGSLYIQDTSYLAHVGDVKLTVGWRGLKGLIAEGELVWLKAEGRGLVFVNAYGGLELLELGLGEKVTIDNMHFVAMDSTVKWDVRRLGGLKTLAFGGEGLVIEVTGPGRVFVQTRVLPPLAQLLSKFMPRSGK